MATMEGPIAIDLAFSLLPGATSRRRAIWSFPVYCTRLITPACVGYELVGGSGPAVPVTVPVSAWFCLHILYLYSPNISGPAVRRRVVTPPARAGALMPTHS